MKKKSFSFVDDYGKKFPKATSNKKILEIK